VLIVWGPEWDDRSGDHPGLRHRCQRVLDSSDDSALHASERLKAMVFGDPKFTGIVVSNFGNNSNAFIGWAFIDASGFHGYQDQGVKDGKVIYVSLESTAATRSYAFAAARIVIPYPVNQSGHGNLPSGLMAAGIARFALQICVQRYGLRSAMGPPFSSIEVTRHGLN
jgi:hypothetical protein